MPAVTVVPRYFWTLVVAASLAACSSEATTEPEQDAGTLVVEVAAFEDASVADAGPADATLEVLDAGAPSVSPAALGVITGSCGELDDELTSTTPATVTNKIDFGLDPFDDVDGPRLTEGGREIIADGNAGGSSILSEVFAFEVLSRCEGARLVKTETEVDYTMSGKITDLLVMIDGMKVGVSVTRAVTFPRDAAYTQQQARVLLERKLSDILVSSANVVSGDRWVKQILHVIAYAPAHVVTLLEAYATIDPAIRADTILYVTETAGDDEFIY